ncbi:pyridoxamine 5'-phosphate oxidase family protein [Gluconacetobacter takamatsuzukensis]|uniref:Pyridoxamine 5'-phosphate oxidase family protein n=1 Tax=Gluconacetobacter takamatsuzukensis TaxID=1286190 RepID=A0A7W4KFD4_9PROT|nr:pyridoxamine 5'-phosphate oxidase family protein [Gluconacetobacter takamatsuzukensis]MBB2205947.1 pyridoxamine 5'-phosphate oxidase family protein [Gluconacetobacter takamatsuzukensis]
MTEPYPVTERSRVRRAHQRGSHERADVHAVLDASPLCHVGYVIDGAPYVTPTLQWRVGDRVYWHGSAASRFLRAARGTRVCLTCSQMDGYVMARSAFSHSVNYRSAMVFGTANLLEGEEEIGAALRDMIEDYFPGRWDTLRPMTDQERKATAVLWMDIEEASVKVRDAPPGDGAEGDYPVWAGVIPIRTVLDTPCPAPELPADMPLPPGLAALVASGRLRQAGPAP